MAESEQFCTGTIVISSENAPISISDLNRFLGHFFPLEGGNWGGNWASNPSSAALAGVGAFAR